MSEVGGPGGRTAGRAIRAVGNEDSAHQAQPTREKR